MRLLPFDYAARNAGRRPVRTILISLGAGAVVFLVLLMGAFVESLTGSLRGTGSPLNVIVLGSGSEDFLEQSEIGREVPTVLGASVSGIAKHHGQPMISPEIHHATVVRPHNSPPEAQAFASVPHTQSTSPQNEGQNSQFQTPNPQTPDSSSKVPDSKPQSTVLLRGITPAAFLVHRQVYITEGQIPGPGEVLVGRLAATKLGLPPEALRPGRQIVYEGLTATISGTFEAPGTAFESEVWVPLDDLLVQTKRTTITCAIARLTAPSQAVNVQIFCKTRLDLEIAAVGEDTYYAALARFLRPVQIMGWAMAGLVVVAGLFGGLNAMLAAVTARAREIACLETLGFRRTAITLSLLQEALLQAGTGALLAAALAQAVLPGAAVRITMGAVSLQLGPRVLLAGFAAALVLAVVGTLLPALRLLRTPLVELLRS